MTMTPKQLRAKIWPPPVWDYDTRGTWGTWYRSQEEHWRGWLADYDGPGYYNRKDCNRSSRVRLQPHQLCGHAVVVG